MKQVNNAYDYLQIHLEEANEQAELTKHTRSTQTYHGSSKSSEHNGNNKFPSGTKSGATKGKPSQSKRKGHQEALFATQLPALLDKIRSFMHDNPLRPQSHPTGIRGHLQRELESLLNTLTIHETGSINSQTRWKACTQIGRLLTILR